MGGYPGLTFPQGRRKMPHGASGQMLEYHLPLDYVFDPRVDIPALFGTPDFLWVAGDGNTPTVGPALTLTGTPTVGVTPHQTKSGGALASEVGSGSSNRTTATPALDATAGQDIVLAALVQFPKTTTNQYILTSRDAGDAGVSLWASNGLATLTVYDGTTAVSSTVSAELGSVALVIGLVDGDGNSEISINGATPVDPETTPSAAPLGDGVGVGLFSRVDKSLDYEGGIIWVSGWVGDAIYDVWSANSYAMISRIAALALGVAPTHGDLSTFARASAASWQNRNGIWAIASSGLPRAGDATSAGESGLRLAPARTNNCYRNINPADTTGYTAHGGVLTAEDGSTELDAAGFGAFGPNVFKYVAGSGHVWNNDQIGNTNQNAFSIVARGASGGETLELGYHTDAEPGVFTSLRSIVLTTSFQRYTIVGTPGNASDHWAISGGNSTYYFTCAQVEEGSVPTSIIPNWATAAAASRLAETLTLPITPRDASGGVEFGITPLGWSSGDIGVACKIVERSGGVTLLVSIESGGAVEATDGTTTVGTQTVADGVRSTVKLTWGPGGLVLTVDGTAETVAYDGALPQSGTLKLEASTAEVAIDDFRVL